VPRLITTGSLGVLWWLNIADDVDDEDVRAACPAIETPIRGVVCSEYKYSKHACRVAAHDEGSVRGEHVGCIGDLVSLLVPCHHRSLCRNAAYALAIRERHFSCRGSNGRKVESMTSHCYNKPAEPYSLISTLLM